jgi:hypothetical protein
MSDFENVPAAALVDAVEKLVAKIDDAELASSLQGGLAAMPTASVQALVTSVIDAFRDRGESSEDAAEGAGAPLAALEAGDVRAAAALIAYASEDRGVLKDALAIFAERHGEQLHALPGAIARALAERLQAPRS